MSTKGPTLYAVWATAGAVEVVPLVDCGAPRYLPVSRAAKAEERRLITAAFQTAKRLAGWDRRGSDGVDYAFVPDNDIRTFLSLFDAPPS